MMNTPTVLVSASEFIEQQTKQIEREFKCSRPQPRNKAMGFYGTDKPETPLSLARQQRNGTPGYAR